MRRNTALRAVNPLVYSMAWYLQFLPYIQVCLDYALSGTGRMPVGGNAKKIVKIWKEVSQMLGWAITFFVIAIIAGLLGFTGIAGAAVGIAKILFFLFLVLFVVFLIFGRRAAPPL